MCLLLVGAPACSSSDSLDLFVDLRTDLRPGTEIDTVQIELRRGADVVRMTSTTATAGQDFGRGRRVAELGGLSAGDYVLRVEVSLGGGAVAQALVPIALTEDRAVTVLLTRDCRDVACPGVGDGPESTACLAGGCVDPDCVIGQATACATDCTSAADCAAGPACVRVECLAGACLYFSEEASCGTDGGVDRCVADGDCNDGHECTLDACESGICVRTPVNTVCDDDIACTLDTCEVAVGCTHMPDCDDGFDCTKDVCDTLGTGECVHTTSDAACMDGIDCTMDSCSLTAGCVNAPTAACDDGVACTADACEATGCTHSPSSAACSDGVACTVDICEPTGCAHVPDGASCNDGIACTVDTCDAVMGCLQRPENSICDDGVACTVDACAMGGCTNTPNNARCTATAGGTCHPTMGCQYPTCNATTCRADPALCETATCTGSTCVRATTCTGGQVCCAGSCVAPGCNDGDPCTDDSCGSSGCVNTVDAARTCNDGNACTSADVCRTSGTPTCRGTALVCNDGNVCTTDSCNPMIGCVFTNNTAPCSDGNMCTMGDVCLGGICRPGVSSTCGDGNVCTDDSCNPMLGCVHTNNTAPCNDGNMCTTGDTCMAGTCMFGTVVNCADEWDCTVDTCIPATGCLNRPDHRACDDMNECTTDICDPSISGEMGPVTGCVHTPIVSCLPS